MEAKGVLRSNPASSFGIPGNLLISLSNLIQLDVPFLY